MPLGKRLTIMYDTLKEKKIIKNKQDFCNSIGINYTAFNKYCKNEYTFKVTSNIIRCFSKNNLNLAWLLDGEGSMFLDEEPRYENNKELKKEELSPFEGDVYIQKQNRIAVQPYEDTEDYCFITLIPQRLSAGIGQPDSQIEMVKQIPISRDLIYPYRPHEVAAAMVIGDSMIDSGLCNRDIVFYIKDTLEGNGIYVIEIGNETLVKRLEFDYVENTVTIISDNPSYKQKTISKDSDILRIKGKVKFWFHRDY